MMAPAKPVTVAVSVAVLALVAYAGWRLLSAGPAVSPVALLQPSAEPPRALSANSNLLATPDVSVVRPTPTISALPSLVSTQTAPPRPEPAVGFDAIQIGRDGDGVIAGHGPPNVRMLAVLDDRTIAETQTDANGQFVILPQGLAPGKHVLSLRVATANGSPSSASADITVPEPPRRDIAATPPKLAASVPVASGPANAQAARTRLTAKVARGDSLWRISRAALGFGRHYPQIEEANRSIIRDPNRIYPGQVFLIPGAREVDATGRP